MSMDPTLVRRIVGTASLLLLVALGYLGTRWAGSPPAGSYEVTAVLGRAGSGLGVGTDVKVRGVAIGRVSAVDFRDGEAVATLRFDPEPRLPDPARLTMVVTAKTLLGEKQIELSFPEGALGEGPFLEAGDTLVADRPPTEVQEVLDVLGPFFDAIDPEELATIVDTLGQQQGEGETIARNLEVGDELAAFGAETADDQLDRFRALTDIAEALEPRADDFNRMNANLPGATSLLIERTDDIGDSLDALSTFSVGLAELLEVEEPALVQLAQTSDLVGAVFDRNMPRIGEIVGGIYSYARSFPQGGLLDDGTEFAYFRIFLGGGDFAAQLCRNAGDLAEFIPVCQGGDA